MASTEFDEVELSIIESYKARGMCHWSALIRYRTQRENDRAMREYAEYVSRLTDKTTP